MTQANNPKKLYDRTFYNAQSSGSLLSAKAVLGYFFDLYQPASLVDFGCGTGSWLTAAHQLGIPDLVGIDGDWIESEKLNPEAIHYHLQNLQKPISLHRTFDLALSLEVAEHLPPKRAKTFIQDICQASDLVIFGAAIPNQGGTHHINEQKQSYWISQFEDQGYHCFDLFRPVFWNSSDVEWWYAQNTFLYLKPHHFHFDRLQEHIKNLSLISDIYHPRLFSYRFRSLQKLEKKCQQLQPQPLSSSGIHLTVGHYGYLLETEGQPPLYLQDEAGNITPQRFPWVHQFIAIRQFDVGYDLLWCHPDGKLAKWSIDSSGYKQTDKDLSQTPFSQIASAFQISETALRSYQ